MMAGTSLRGQVSLELLVTLGVVMAFTLPVVFLLLSVSSVNHEKATKDQADAAARSLADTINIVYSQGDGAKRVVLMNAPASTKIITMSGNEVTVTIGTSAGDYDGVSPVFADLTPQTQNIRITQRTGLFALSVENIAGKVSVNETQG